MMFSCFISLNSIAQLGGSLIYKPVFGQDPPVVQQPKVPSVLDEIHKQDRQRLELEILREQKLALQNQNNRTQSDPDLEVFKLENVNYLNSNLELTEWQTLSSPHYAYFYDGKVQLKAGLQIKIYDLDDCIDNNDGSYTFKTLQGTTIGAKPLEKGLCMFIFVDLDKKSGIAYVGTVTSEK